MDVFKKCFEFTQAEDYKKLGLYPYFTEIEKVEGNHVWVDGKKILMVGSNNYLGLFDDSRIKAAAIAAIEKYGTSTCGSRSRPAVALLWTAPRWRSTARWWTSTATRAWVARPCCTWLTPSMVSRARSCSLANFCISKDIFFRNSPTGRSLFLSAK